MNRYCLTPIFIVLVLGVLGSVSRAESEDKNQDRSSSDINAIINRLDYPEFQVVPRASERLRIEAKEEDYDWAYVHWQIELSGFATLTNSLMANGEFRNELSDAQARQATQAALAGKVVGLGWMAAGVLVGAAKPYRRGFNALSRYPGKDERTTLLRERLAEEAIGNEARLMKPLVWFSVISQCGTNLLVGSFVSDQGRVIAGMSALLSLLPLIFDDHSILVHEKSLEYKTRIYRPLSTLNLRYDEKGRNYMPVAGLTWVF